MTPQARSARLSPAARREQLLSAARELLRSHPAAEVTVDAVAASAGVSPGLVFHYFGSQREFRHAVVELAAAELLSKLGPSPELAPAEQLRAGLETFTLAVEESPELFVAVISAAGSLAPAADSIESADSLASGCRAAIGGWLRAGVLDAGVAMTPALDAALGGWLAFAEEVVLRLVTSRELTRSEVVALCLDGCLALLAVAGVPPDKMTGLGS